MDNLIRAYAARRYAILFYSLLATLIATPLLAVLDIDAEPLEILLALNLLAGALGLGAGWRRRALLSVTIAALLFHFGSAQFAVGLRPAAHAFWAVIAFLTAAAALRFAMSSTRVDAEHLYAALSTYLL